jgi:pimeloyl-ACP methyl ester carboxylesterase
MLAVNGTTLYYEQTGAGQEAIVFSHGLLWSNRMFEAQVAHFKERYRCMAYDHRGQGHSAIARSGYDMETVYQDGVALIEALQLAPVHFVGLSMGGFVGMRLAARRPDLLKSLILMETSADPEPPENIPRYRLLNFIARWLGFRPVTKSVMQIMFSQSFLNDPTRQAERDYWQQQLWNNHRVGITRAVQGVITRQGVYEELPKIALRTLIIVGEEDVATVPAKSERIQAQIRGSQLVRIPQAGHTSSVEQPARVNSAIEQFLATL